MRLDADRRTSSAARMERRLGLRWRRLASQQGTALVIAIGMLAFVSLLASVVLTSVNRELGSVGEAAAKREAFYAAERAVEYSLNRELILGIPGTGSVNLMTGTDGNGVEHHVNIDAGSARGTLQSGIITDSGPGMLPVRMAELYGSEFGANYYDVSVSATGPKQTRTRIDTQVVRLFKLDDDSIFRTTGGGG